MTKQKLETVSSPLLSSPGTGTGSESDELAGWRISNYTATAIFILDNFSPGHTVDTGLQQQLLTKLKMLYIHFIKR